MRSVRCIVPWVLVIFLAAQFGCASYVTPGRGVSMASLTNVDDDIRERLLREPTASFPARMAVVRIQEPGYRSHYQNSYGSGKYSVLTTRDFETDAHFERLTRQPMIAGVAPLNRLVIPSTLNDDKDLRLAAATVRADLLLVYTLDSVFNVDEYDLGPLRLITLGTAPTKNARVTCTASAALFDVRTGYVYGLTESTARDDRIASAWTRADALDAARRDAEAAAFEQMLGEFEKMWKGVVEEHAGASARRGT